ncbi:MAG: Ig-like domain-containing protein [Rhizobiaceae bacterium]
MLSAFGKIFKRDRAVLPPSEERPLMRVLEPRILLDAAGMETARDMADQSEDSTAAMVDALAPEDFIDGAARDLSRDIVFIDGEVENIGELLGELDPDVEIHILDLHEDGVEQIADILEGREDILAVHIFSHGGQGFLNLGSSQLSLETMSSTHADALNRIGDALSEEGDILVYGCDFASGEVGKVAAQALARATGADIAASNDVTGAADLGGDWDLEVVQGDVETQALEVEGFKGVLGAFELGTVDPPTVTYVNEFTPAGAPQFGSVGETGTVAIWENAGTVDTGTEVISVDVRATVVSVTNTSEIFVGFGTRDDDEGDNDDATIDDFRVYVHNTSAVAGGSNSGNIGSATIVWEVFKTGTNQTERADIGEVSLTTADIDGTAAGTTTTRETLAAALSDLSSYTVQAGTNLEVSNDGVNLRATGTADQDSEESSWVQYSWNSINQLTMIYESRTPYAYFNHDGDGDLVFTNPETSFATGIDLDMNDSSGATGSNYQTIFYSNATSGTPVAIADGDIMVTNEAGSATSATITLTNALAGDLLNVDTAVLASLGLTGSVDTSIAGEITVTLAGNASATDYQTAIQSITFENTNYGSIDTTPRSIDVQVFDGAFASGIANTAVTFGTIINQPTANHDVYVGQEDTGLSVTGANSLLSNDDDPNGAALSVRSATDGAGNPIAVNAVGTLTPVSHTMPTGAVITLYDDGTFDYVPPADYSGVEFFNYTVENTGGFVGQSYASINIQGVADTPVVTNGLISAAADEDAASGTLDLTATQGDADGSESLRYSVSLIPTGYTITDGVRSFTSNGTSDIAYLDGWDLTTISLVPPTPDQHSDLDIAVQLTVEASEPNGSSTSASESVTFRFDAVADAPTLTVTSGGAGPGALLNVSPLVSATLTDIDGSEEIVSYVFSNIPAGATFYVGTTPQFPVGGVVTIAAADFAALRLEVPNTVGNYSVDVMAVSSEVNAENQISQLTANSTVETLNFTVDNIDDPVTANDDNYTVFGGQTVVLNPLGNDLVPDGGPVITQVDGQTISAGQTRSLASGAGDVTLNADGTLTFVAAAGFSGQDTFTYVVEDADGSTDTANITLDAPTWSIVGDASVGEGGSASYTITLDATPPMGTPISVDISAINVDTTLADYGDLAAAIQTAADASSYFTFDGTTLTYAADYESAQVAGSNFQDVSSDPSATALGIGLFDPTRVGLGFDFDFYGETYSDIYVSDFGILTFGGGSPGGGGAYNNTSFAAGNTLGGLPAIAPFWDIIGMDRTNSDEVYTLTQGLPGEREFIVQFNDVVIYFNDTAGETITFQAVLREGSNEIEFRYDDVTMTNTTYSLGASATVGLSDGSGTRFEEFSFATASLSDNTRIVFSADNVAASKSLTFSLGANADGIFEGPEDYSISLSNADGSAVSATSGAATTTITDVNQAPSNTVPVTGGTAIPATTVDEDSALVFNAGNGNAIVVDDPDGDSLTVTLSVTNGTLIAATGSGATIGGDGTATLTLSGTQAQVNTALDGLSYTGIGDFNGTDQLTISTDDNGGQLNSVTVSTVDLAVTAVDDIVSNSAPIISGNTVTIDVLGNDSFEGTVTNVSATNGANGTVVVNGDNTITYTWTGAASSGLDSFTYTVTSGGVTETSDVMIILQTPTAAVNDSNATDEDTVLNVASGGVLTNDYGSAPTPALDYNTIDVSGAPNGSWSSGVAGLDLTWSGGITQNNSPTTAYPGLTESLVFDGSGGATSVSLQDISGNPSDADASFEIWFKYDPADYASGLGAVLYETGGGTDGMSIALSDSTGSGSSTIDHLLVQFNDGGNTIVELIDLEAVLGVGNISNEFINVSAVYDKDASGGDDEVRLYVNGILLATQTTTGLNDWADSSGSGLGTTSNNANIGSVQFGNFTGEIAGLKFTEAALTDAEVKSRFDSVAGLSVVSHDVTSSLGATVVVNADGSYSYDPTSVSALQAMQAGDSLADSFTYTISDANGTLSMATVNLTVAGVNDAPAGTDIAVALAEDSSHVLSVADFGFDDPIDGTNDNFADVVFASVPADGDLIYDDGVAPVFTIIAGQTISTADIAAGYVTFVPDADANNTQTAGADYASFQFQVVDDGGTASGGVDTDQLPNTFTFNVTPVDDAVAHNVPGAQTATEDTPLAIAGVSVVDVDGDALTTVVSLPAGSGILNVTTGTGAGLSGDGSGTVTLTGTAVQINAALAGLTYTPADDFNTDGAGPFNLTITSDDGGLPVFNTVSIAVDPVADIVGDTVSTAEDTTLTFDAIGGAFGADNFESGSAAVTGVTQGANGTVSINGSGEIVYVPDANFNGVDSFSYTVTSGGVTETATVSVTITPVNDGPTLVDDTATGAEDGVAIIGDVLANDSDVDLDGLTVVSYVVSGVAGTHAADATTSIPGVGDITLNSDGSFSFAPDADYNGSVPQITYTATDGTATATAYLDITVTPVDDAPVAAGDVATTAEDITLVVDAASGVLSNDHDGDGGALGTGVNVTEFDVGGITYTAGATANLAEGDLTLNGDGSYTFAPASNYHGPIPQVTYTVSDGALTDTSTLNITVTPENDAPVVTAPAGTVNGTEDTGLVFSVIGGNAISIGDIDIASGDPGTTSVTLSVDHGTLTASLGSGAGVVGDGTDTVVLSGTVAQVNAALDGLLYTGVADFHGGDLISVSVDDGTGSANAITAGSVLINVTAVADIVDDAVSTNEDTAVGFNVVTGLTAGNPDGASADGFLSSTPILTGIGAGPDAPQNGVVSISPDGSIVYTPNADFHGVDSFTYTIETPDGDGGVVSETGTVTITVNPVNDTPVQTVPDTSGGPIAATTTTEDGTITFTAANGNSLLVADVDGPNLSTVISVTYGVLTPASGSGATITAAGTGSVTISGTAAQINAALDGLVYTPNDDFNTDGVQSESMVMTTDDGSGAGNAITTDTVALGITGVADAVNDAISTNEDTAAAFNVLTGLTAGLADGASADNFENAGHTVTGVTQGTYGSVSFDAAGNVTYTPQTNYNVSIGGVDTFTYTVTTDDGQGGAITETATVSVTVISVNDSPDAVGNAYIGPEDVAITGNLITDDTSGTAGSESGVDSDVETLLGGLTIASFTVAGTTGPNPDSSWPAGTSATAPGFGTLTVNGDGTFNLAPSANYVGAFPAVTYTLDDGSGAAPGANGPTDTAPAVFTFTAVNDDPTASGLNPTTAEDVAVSGTITMNDPDLPSGPDVLTASLDSGPGSAPNNGSVVVNSDGSYTYTPDPDFNGIDTFTVYVEDGQGGSTTTTITVTVTPVNDAPVAAADAATTAEDTPLIVNAASGVLSNDHDGDGSGLGVGVTVTTFTVDGTPYAANATANLTQGDLTLNDDGSYSFVPAANFNGSVPQVTYTVSDGGLTDTATLDINVTPVNDQPVASDDAYTVNEDSVTGISGNLILDDGGFGVDTDVDGDSLVITAAIVDLDGNGIGDPVAFNTPLAITDNLANPIGTLTLQTNGLFSFVPAADYFGTVPAITYTIDDGTGAINSSDIGVLTIAVAPVNDAPDASNDAVAGNEDQVISLNPTLPVDVDDAQSVLTVVVGQVPLASQGTLSYTPDGGGAGTVLPGQVLSMTELTSVTFLSALNYNGSVDNFTYQAMDDEGETDAGSIGSVAITLTAVNDAPTAVNDGPVAVTEDVAVSGNVLTNDSDIDGDSITVVDFTVAGVPGPVTADSMATIPGVGTLVINTNGSFTFTPATNYNGAVPAISYTISDGNGLTDTASLSFADVTPVNDDPNATANSYSVSEDTNLAGNLLLDDTGAGLDFDLDGDGISVSGFSVLGETGPFLLGTPLTIAGVGELTVLSNGNFSFDPATNYNGGVPQITYSITDGVGGSASAVVDITVDPVNDAPTVTSPTITTAEDQVAVGAVTIADVDGDVPVASLDTAPVNGTAVVNPDGTWSYTPSADFHGTDQFDILVDDLNGGTASVTVFVTITPVADVADDQIVTPEDTPISFNVLTGSGTIGGVGGPGADTFEGSPVVTSVTHGSHGSVTFNAAGDVVYTPDPNYNGPDSFTYTVLSGGFSETATVTVNVSPVNDLPTGVSTPATTLEDTPVSGSIAMTDIDGDTVTASAGPDPDHGSVTVNPDGTWTYVPDADFEGTDSFTIIIDDGNGGTNTVLVDITVIPVNDAPDAVSTMVEISGTDPVSVSIPLPTDVDDVSAVLLSTIQQVPDPSAGSLTYLPGGVSGTPVQLTVGMVLTNVELSTLVYTAFAPSLGSNGMLVYQTQDDSGATDGGSIASIVFKIVAVPNNAIFDDSSFPETERERVDETIAAEPIVPFVVDAVNEIADLGSVGDLDPNNGIVLNTVSQIAPTNATTDLVPVDPAVLDAVQAIDALRQVHLENSGASPEMRSISTNDWGVESLTGFSLKFTHDAHQEEDQGAYSDSGQLVIETYVRERILFIDVTNTFDPDVEGVVNSYRVEMADGSELPDWIRIVRDGFVIAERPANLWDLSLKISAEMEDGSLITRGVVIDGPTGEIQPLNLDGQEDGKRFEDKLRQLVNT